MHKKMINYRILKRLRKKIYSSFFWRANRLLFKLNGISFGKNLIVNGTFIIDIADTAQVSIGDDCFLNSGRGLNPLCGNRRGDILVRDNAYITIGNNCGFSSPIFFIHKGLRIGNHVNVGANVTFLDSDCHSINYMDRRTLSIDELKKKDKEIIIDDDVLIGMNCQILKGVHIGARSIIGAGSVVTKDIPSDSIAAGNPAIVIKTMRHDYGI